jgi:diguanylate cyclase (GGDEF)-like protein
VFTIFVVDLNELKRINDTLGHLTGNEVIAAVARALRGCLREYDFAARLGGDEFVILLPGLGPEDAAEKRLDLRAAVEALRGEFPRVEISVSMGSASYPADGRQVDQLVSLADKRMYWHKRQRYATRTSGVPA